jgi:Flp pilus assembly protein TadD
MTAMRIDPNYPPQYAFILGFAQFDMGQFEAAAKSFENATRGNSNYQEAFVLLTATYGYLNRKHEAASAIARLNQLSRQGEHWSVNAAAAYYGSRFKESQDVDRIIQGLRLAGFPAYY